MANREALRELQSRLATRLQAARTGDVGASWLAVESSGKSYLLPLSQAGEIFPWTPTSPVPYAQPWFMGVTNLRGGLFGVVDLGAYLDPDHRLPISEFARSETRLITFNPALEINCGLLIDKLSGLRHLDTFTTSRPAADGSPEFMGAIYTAHDGLDWQEINLQALSRQTQFLSISA
jgi:twitching motility protein PilI